MNGSTLHLESRLNGRTLHLGSMENGNTLHLESIVNGRGSFLTLLHTCRNKHVLSYTLLDEWLLCLKIFLNTITPNFPGPFLIHDLLPGLQLD
jgi:hypothetical protein